MSDIDFDSLAPFWQDRLLWAMEHGIHPNRVERCFGCGRCGEAGADIRCLEQSVDGEPESMWWCDACRGGDDWAEYESK